MPNTHEDNLGIDEAMPKALRSYEGERNPKLDRSRGLTMDTVPTPLKFRHALRRRRV